MKKFISIILSIGIILSVNMSAYAASYDKNNNNTEYVYEEKSYQWKCTASHEEMVDGYQIPDDEIKKMSTQQLLSAYLNYPLLGNIFCYDNNMLGFNILKEECNALKELLSRKDACVIILSKYNAVELYDSISANNASFHEFIEPWLLKY